MGKRKKCCGYHGVWSAPEGLGIWELSRDSCSAKQQQVWTILEDTILNFPADLVSKHIQRLPSAGWSRFFCLWTIKLTQAQNGIYWLKYLRMSQGHARLIKVQLMSSQACLSWSWGSLSCWQDDTSNCRLIFHQFSILVARELLPPNRSSKSPHIGWCLSALKVWVRCSFLDQSQQLEQCWLKSVVFSWSKDKTMIPATAWIENRERGFLEEAVVNVVLTK